MNILTVENVAYDLNRVPDEVDDIRYCVYDTNDPENMDYYFLPLIFLEVFNAPAISLEIGEYIINMPLDWSILTCDSEYTDIEFVPLTSLNDRGFHTLLFNPYDTKFPITKEVNIINVYSDVKWYFPKIRNGLILVVPVESGPKPRCALFVKERNKIPSTLDVGDILE